MHHLFVRNTLTANMHLSSYNGHLRLVYTSDTYMIWVWDGGGGLTMDDLIASVGTDFLGSILVQL